VLHSETQSVFKSYVRGGICVLRRRDRGGRRLAARLLRGSGRRQGQQPAAKATTILIVKIPLGSVPKRRMIR